MLKKNSIYLCKHCGNIIESLWNGKPSISCCGEEMTELNANTTDAATEKHIPVVEREGNIVKVKIGETAHPMTPEHYILFIEVVAGQNIYRHNFIEGDTAAEAVFEIEQKDISVRAYCNKHGLWQS